MDADQRLMDDIVTRVAELRSKQPRYSPKSDGAFYSSIQQWVRKSHLEEPVYQTDTRRRDAWLQQFWRLEPHLAGVLGSVVSIDQNRGWSMIGGKTLVRHFTDILNDADEGVGWREHAGMAALAYYSCDLGSVIEVGRTDPDPEVASLAALYSVDPTRCRAIRRHAPNVTSVPSLDYFPSIMSKDATTRQEWYSYDYMKLSPLPQIEEKMNGIGFSAVSRCLDLAKIMIGVFEHDLEMLRVAPPSGFLTVSGIGMDQFQDALAMRKEERKNNNLQYASDLVYLVSDTGNIDLKLTALSSLPANFSMEDFVQILMLGYALCLGYDASEFYSIKYSPLTNAGTATKVQSQKATAKGELNFVLAYQSALQRWLPPTITMEFDERSDEGDKLRADIAAVQASTAATLTGAGIFTPEISLDFLVENKTITQDLADIALQSLKKQQKSDKKAADQQAQAMADAAAQQADQATADSTTKDTTNSAKVKEARRRAREDGRVIRCAELYPHEQIISRDRWGREMVLFDSGAEMLQRHSFPVIPIRRDAVYYEKDGVEITKSDLDEAAKFADDLIGDDFVNLLKAV